MMRGLCVEAFFGFFGNGAWRLNNMSGRGYPFATWVILKVLEKSAPFHFLFLTSSGIFDKVGRFIRTRF